ncbi:hypothetical protein GCM10028803_07280 [Larkinella knui]|uniref:Uncharacterized protein n=1 Tax=Larkinella knui TaxID=2025310 RepID=A0A3P1CK43_9BACT|nr:hypothetical protein [Larkinella knui]RRB13598.1 hypothetical protein EHT87_15160 [Larkinella knui]
MKKLLSLLILVLLLSCNNSFYHVATVQSEQVKPIDNNFVFENEHLKVVYNLWEKGGRMRFLLFNKTDLPIYLDWSKSFMVRNGTQTLYSQLPAFTKRAYVDTVHYQYQQLDILPYRLTARSNQITELPSRIYVAIADFPIQQTVVNAKTKEKVITYSQENSPLRFGQQLTYSFDQTRSNPHQITHSFWISQIQVLRSGELFRQYGPLYKGHPNALYAVETRLAAGRSVGIALSSVAVSYLLIMESMKHMFDGVSLCC